MNQNAKSRTHHIHCPKTVNFPHNAICLQSHYLHTSIIYFYHPQNPRKIKLAFAPDIYWFIILNGNTRSRYKNKTNTESLKNIAFFRAKLSQKVHNMSRPWNSKSSTLIVAYIFCWIIGAAIFLLADGDVMLITLTVLW